MKYESVVRVLRTAARSSRLPPAGIYQIKRGAFDIKEYIYIHIAGSNPK